MRVKCVTNDIRALDNKVVEDRLRRSIHLDGPMGELQVGRTYNVVALQESDGGVWVMLDTVEDGDYPYPYPLEMFEVTDCALPAGWCVNFARRSNGAFIQRVSFCEWATDGQFYERLVDGDEKAVGIYRRERAR